MDFTSVLLYPSHTTLSGWSNIFLFKTTLRKPNLLGEPDFVRAEAEYIDRVDVRVLGFARIFSVRFIKDAIAVDIVLI